MSRKEILSLLEEDILQEEQKLIKKVNIGRLAGKIAPPIDFKQRIIKFNPKLEVIK